MKVKIALVQLLPGKNLSENLDIGKKACVEAKDKDADIVLANDPDADRIGLYVKDNEGNYVPFTGNMTAMLILEYQLSQKKAKGILPKDSAVISTVVSTISGSSKMISS